MKFINLLTFMRFIEFIEGLKLFNLLRSLNWLNSLNRCAAPSQTPRISWLSRWGWLSQADSGVFRHHISQFLRYPQGNCHFHVTKAV